MPVSSVQQASLVAHQAATRALPKVVEDLVQLLGARLVAYIGGVGEARAAREWAAGSRHVKSEQVGQRLRTALQVARLLAETDSAEVVRAWFIGANPELEDRSPARMLRDGDPEDVSADVLAAARSFLIGG